MPDQMDHITASPPRRRQKVFLPTAFDPNDFPPAHTRIHDGEILAKTKDVDDFLHGTVCKNCPNCLVYWFRFPKVPAWLKEFKLHALRGFGNFDECAKCVDPKTGKHSEQRDFWRAMHLGEKLEAVSMLTSFEARCISLIAPVVSVYSNTATGGLKYGGHVSANRQNVVKFMKSMPRGLRDIPEVFLSYSSSSQRHYEYQLPTKSVLLLPPSIRPPHPPHSRRTSTLQYPLPPSPPSPPHPSPHIASPQHERRDIRSSSSLRHVGARGTFADLRAAPSC